MPHLAMGDRYSSELVTSTLPYGMPIEHCRGMPMVEGATRGLCGQQSSVGMKESAVKQALRRAQWTFYALAPVLLVLGYHTMGKRWG